MKKKLLNLMKLRTAMMLAAVVVTFLGQPTKAWADDVASVTIDGYGTWNFASLDQAIKVVNEPTDHDATRKLTLLSNVTDLSSSLSFSHSSTFILDLNGHTLSGSASTLISILSGSTLTITDSGTGGTISATGNGKEGSAGLGVVDNNGTLIISGGTITATGSEGIGIISSNATLTVSGGTISATGSDGRGIVIYGTTFTVTGGTIIGKDRGIYSAENSNLIISGGTFKGCNTAIRIEDGTFSLNGLPSFGSGDDANTLDIYSNILIPFGAAITDKPAQPIKMELYFSSSSLPYTFTSGYGTYCKYTSGANSGQVIAPDDFFNVVNAGPASLGLTEGNEVKLYQKDPGDYCGDPNVNEGKDVFWSYNSSTKTLTISGTGAMADYTKLEKVPWHSEVYTTVTIGDNITHIGDNAFNSSGISTVTIPAKVTSIGDNAFYNSSISTVTIPSKVTSIGKNAFFGCTSLTSVVFADGSQLESIGEQAFFRCTTLPSITIPATVKTIGSSAFERCELLQTVAFNAGCLLESIGKNAFSSCSSLESITVPSTVTSIGNSAFYNSALTSITIPASVTGIGDYAFEGCSNLSSVYLMPATPPTLGTEAFNGISGTGILYVRSADFKTATNWSGYSTKMKVMSTVTIGDDLIISDPYINEGGYYYVEGNEVGVKNADGFDYNTFIVKKTASGETISVTGPDVYGFYSFTMPDEAVTVTALLNKTYALTIAGIQVNDLNKDNILESTGATATVSFTPATETTPNTLTLNGATITGPVKVGLPNLTIDIQGTNSIITDETCIQKLDGTTPAVTFKSTSDVVGSLTLNGVSGVNNIGSDNLGSFSISDELALVLKKDGKFYSDQYWLTDGSTKEAKLSPSYGVTVGSMQICPDNAADVIGDGIGDGDDSGMVSFDKDNSILTLNNASLSGIIRSSLPNLKIELVGDNSIYSGGDRILQAGVAVNMTIQSSAAEKGSLSMHKGFSSSEKGNFVDDNVTLTISAPLAVISGSLTDDIDKNDYYAVIGESYGLTVAGVIVSKDNAANITGGGIAVDESKGGKVSYDAATHTLTLKEARLFTNESHPEPMITCNGDLIIQLTGENYIVFSGDYANYVVKNTGNSGTLTITQSGTDAVLGITSVFCDGDSKGLCDGFSAVNFANGLAYSIYSGSKRISTLDLASPNYYLYDNTLIFQSNGLLYGTNNNGEVVGAEYFYKITYVDSSTEGSGVEHQLNLDYTICNIDQSQTIAVNSLAGPCTIETYTKLNGETSTANKAKKFGPAENPMRLVYEADPVDFVLAPAIEEGDDIKVNGIEANVTYNATSGKVSSSTLGSHGAVVSLGYQDEPNKTTILLNHYFNMDFDVVPPAPTVSLAAGTYLKTQNLSVTLTASEIANTAIEYKWDDGDWTAYSTPLVPETGTHTLYARVKYQDATPVYSDEVSATYTVGIVFDVSNMFSGTQTYATYYNSTGNNMTLPDGMTAAMVTGVNESGTSVTTTALTYIPKDAAVLLGKGTSTGSPASIIYTGDEVSTTDNKLVYTSENKATENKEFYVLYKDEFVKATGTIPVGKCYLDLTGVNIPSGARGLGIENDGTTGIHAVNSEEGIVNSDVWYNLQGRRIEKPTKAGLYIKNGQKQIVKQNHELH